MSHLDETGDSSKLPAARQTLPTGFAAAAAAAPAPTAAAVSAHSTQPAKVFFTAVARSLRRTAEVTLLCFGRWPRFLLQGTFLQGFPRTTETSQIVNACVRLLRCLVPLKFDGVGIAFRKTRSVSARLVR